MDSTETTPPAGRTAPWPAVSVVMPVLDEERHLRTAVRHVLEQGYPGELELVLALGPSKDRTDQIAAELAAQDPRVSTVRNPTGRTPAALNAGIRAARHGIVVRVDGHGMLGPDYVRTAVELLESTGADNVGGIMAAEGESAFEQAVARAMTSWFGVGGARFHTGGEAGPADTVYLGVFRRATLERLGGYDESFSRAQDWELNHRIREGGGLVWFSPRLRVSYRPRPDLRRLARQYFHYGRWRRVVMRRHQGTVSLRYLAAPVVVVAVAAGTVVGVAVHPAGFVLPAGYGLALLAGTALTARGLPPRAAVLLPAVYATMHLAWGAGFLSSPRSLVPLHPQLPGLVADPGAA
ncbi:cellulose synthase/poly-beta-1,6-N-acetylglucosamine synthase-like glycosyltransferase [Motilibacter rhizosphaerae]|uniref:Cellulose synthase/poly-beta-1,6-N-acetylglucosamine synthase-like glycosyltransferase n=1 Tax=Motilibacter rhizosphaerae TaxID=598652 RepID=A0A4Q7NSX1_9ACTN|nr:glycosyltransferase family 2 protein [Motilibacter rhizosphaerae]RZS90221.1 cellulose synthase/poly-beta-1,6-N-acetylglucosamine synthase-like glycosyltransferase [Motilibacter rhizosphaerae]